MTLEEFKTTLDQQTPPENLNPFLKSLWYDKKGNWDMAHDIAQELHNGNGAWIHAYLHRREGDHGNASYWYHMADKPLPAVSLDREWEDLVKVFLKKS